MSSIATPVRTASCIPLYTLQTGVLFGTKYWPHYVAKASQLQLDTIIGLQLHKSSVHGGHGGQPELSVKAHKTRGTPTNSSTSTFKMLSV